jgi:hypothetical protein
MPFTTNATPKDFFFHASPASSALSFAASCFLACQFLFRIAISAPVILLYKFQNYLADECRDKRKSPDRDFTSIWPFFSRYSRRSSFGLAPYHRLLHEVVIQTQISLNAIATI